MVVVFLLMLVVSGKGITLSSAETVCTLDDRKYAIGQTWHPVLHPFGAMHCVNCTCLQSGDVKCESEICPRPECEEPKHLPGTCCPTCQDFDNIPPTVGSNVGEVTATPSPGCIFNGHVYENGDRFSSNRTGLRPTRSNQCVMCVCSGGRVLCHLKSCVDVKCKKYVDVTDNCCPRCEEMSDYEDYLDSILTDTRPANLSESDCLAAKGVKKDGSKWHPVIGLFGEMKCIVCECKKGKVKCNRIMCVPDNQLKCKKPRIIDGACCKSCPVRTPRKRCRKNRKGRLCRRKKKGKKKNCCKKRGRPRGTVAPPTATPKPTSPPATTIKTPGLFDNLCMPRKTDRIVYSSDERHLVIVGFDIFNEGKVEVLKWTVKRGRLSDMQRETMPASNFRRNVTKAHVIGATNKRSYKKFKRKLRKKLQRCKTSCRRKVVSGTLKRLKLKKIKFCDN